MSSLIEEIVREIGNILFCVILARFLFWTGEIVITIISFGFHKPRWKGYSGGGGLKLAFTEITVGLIGFCFWISIFPLGRFFIESS
jgi:hypothetical protein